MSRQALHSRRICDAKRRRSDGHWDDHCGGGAASAEPPRQADVDACTKEAAAGAPQPAASADLGKPSAPAEARPNTKTEDDASRAQPTVKGSEERQAFA